MKRLVIVMLVTIHTACGQTFAPISLGVEGATLNCVDEKCDIVFLVDNQLPHPTKIRYRAVLSNVGEEVVFELSDVIGIPALEKTKISKSVSVTERPNSLRVTVTTLQGL